VDIKELTQLFKDAENEPFYKSIFEDSNKYKASLHMKTLAVMDDFKENEKLVRACVEAQAEYTSAIFTKFPETSTSVRDKKALVDFLHYHSLKLAKSLKNKLSDKYPYLTENYLDDYSIRLHLLAKEGF
jgi:hypothetical protein